ncbi:non-ribosomal peptide synthetase, partial [Paenibacillus oenotherae]
MEKLAHTVDQRPVEGEVELLPVQRMFFEQQLDAPHHFNQSVMVFRQQSFNEEHVRTVFAKLTEHHDALRMVFVREGNLVKAYNRGLDGNHFSLVITDLTSYEDESAVSQRIEKEAGEIQSSMDINQGPLVKLGLFKTRNGDHLLIAIHHLVVDGVSW